MFDSHAHLDRHSFGDDLDAVITRAFEAGVTGIVSLGCGADPAAMEEAVELAHGHDAIRAAVGVHPHEADAVTRASYGALERLLADPVVVALGEVGLDYHYDLSSREGQRKVFDLQIGLAAEMGKPLVIHCREAHEDCLRMLRAAPLSPRPGVIHCFTEGPAMARCYMDIGFLVSVPGLVTFRNPGELLDTVREIPIEHLLVETDSPWLAPVPHRGRRNEPAFIKHTIETVAQLKGLSFDDVSRITEKNARRLFGIPGLDDQANRIIYPIRDSLYVNLTNRCTLRCTFCHKFQDFVVKGHDLRLAREPSVEDVQAAIEARDPSQYREVVFCGYGEPLLRLDAVIALADWIKARGIRVRVNTDGLASLVHDRDVPKELAGRVDAVSVSLNAPDRETYARICPSRYGENGHDAVIAFIKRAAQMIPDVTATVVALPGLDLDACRRLVEQELGVALRIRPLDDLG